MNIFYAPPTQIRGKRIELTGQEAIHANKSLRYRRGDTITVADGNGYWYEGVVQHVAKKSMQIGLKKTIDKGEKEPKVSLAMGIIKKKDRLEFAVEKAVELGVKEIILYRGEHSVKQNIRADRLQTVAVAAMKQSLRAWLPRITFNKSLSALVQHSSARIIAACQGTVPIAKRKQQLAPDTLLVVGPEGGFSDDEVCYLKQNGATLISVGNSRLRTETAALTLLAQYHLLLASPMG